MKGILISLLCILVLIVSGCERKVECEKPYIKVGVSCCLDENDNSICDKDETVEEDFEAEIPKIDVEKEHPEGNKESDFKSYNLEKLGRDINAISKKHYIFRQDEEDQQYYDGNSQKFYVVDVLEDKVYDSKEFYERFSAKNWEGYLHFLNATDMGVLHPPLTEDNFSNEKDYKEYVQERYLVEQTFVENTIDLENGKVLEYQLLNWVYDPFGNFKGSWQDTLLIYKIYCSPNLIVFIRPDWTKLGFSLSGADSDTIRKNWESSINELRQEMLDTSNKILKTCPVNKDFFKDIPSEKFESSETLAYYWKTDYQFYWNLTTDISTEIEPSKEEYLLKRVNISFTNNEPRTLWGDLLLDIDTVSDGKESYEFKSEKRLGEKIKDEETIQRELEADHPDEEKPKFSDNLVINFKLIKYGDGFTIKSGNITIDTDNKKIG